MREKKLLYCNNCGRELRQEGDMPVEGLLQVTWDWGYFSGKDGERHSFCLCEECYDRIRGGFVQPVAVEEYL